MKTLDIIKMELKGIPKDGADDVARAVSDLVEHVVIQGKLIAILQARLIALETRGGPELEADDIDRA